MVVELKNVERVTKVERVETVERIEKRVQPNEENKQRQHEQRNPRDRLYTIEDSRKLIYDGLTFSNSARSDLTFILYIELGIVIGKNIPIHIPLQIPKLHFKNFTK